MIDAATADRLRDVIRRESRSLLQYAGEMFPWTAPEDRELPQRLLAITAEEREAAAGLARFLQRHRVTPPALGAYPMAYTSLGFVSLDYLLPRLVAHQRLAVTQLERDLAAVTDPEAKELLQKMAERKQEHLKALEAMASAPAAR